MLSGASASAAAWGTKETGVSSWSSSCLASAASIMSAGAGVGVRILRFRDALVERGAKDWSDTCGKVPSLLVSTSTASDSSTEGPGGAKGTWLVLDLGEAGASSAFGAFGAISLSFFVGEAGVSGSSLELRVMFEVEGPARVGVVTVES